MWIPRPLAWAEELRHDFAGPEAGFPRADFWGVWGIIKKEFFMTTENMIFLQFLKSVQTRLFRSIKPGVR
jgi:hypothetical protein